MEKNPKAIICLVLSSSIGNKPILVTLNTR